MLCLPQIMLPNQLILGKGNEERQGLVSLIPYLPPVIIWNPLQQYRIYFPRGIKCPICEERLFIRSWNTGKDISTQPRILHDIDCVVLLVGLYYSCPNKHNIISYDPRLLCLILDKTEIPFSLSWLCLKSTAGCTSKCSCKQCDNPNGKTPTALYEKQTRKCQHHQLQSIRLYNTSFLM